MNKEFKDMKEWQESIDLAVDVHKLMSGMPREEYENPYSLSNEIKNTAMSIPCNLSSGYEVGEGYLTENLIRARGLLAKLESQLMLAININLIEEEKAEELIKRVRSVRELMVVDKG